MQLYIEDIVELTSGQTVMVINLYEDGKVLVLDSSGEGKPFFVPMEDITKVKQSFLQNLISIPSREDFEHLISERFKEYKETKPKEIKSKQLNPEIKTTEF
jgi:hypothetical protein